MSFGMRSRFGRSAAMLLIATVIHPASTLRADVERGDASPSSTRLLDGDGFSVRVLIDPTIIRSSDQLRITLEFMSESPTIREYDIEFEDHAVWMVQRRSSALRDELRASIRAEFVLEPYLVGEWPTPRFMVTPAKYDGTRGEMLVIKPVEIGVLSVLDDESDLAEVLDVVDPPDHTGATERTALMLTIALGGALVGGLGVALALRRRSGGQAIESCDAVALRRLDDLAGSGLMQADTMDRYYLELTTILREYIEQRFGINAPDRTTEEFLRDPDVTSEPANREFQNLGALLERADGVKFARVTVGTDEAMRAFVMVKDFITRSARTGEAMSNSEAEVRE